jgi:hypothetical protein
MFSLVFSLFHFVFPSFTPHFDLLVLAAFAEETSFFLSFLLVGLNFASDLVLALRGAHVDV